MDRLDTLLQSYASGTFSEPERLELLALLEDDWNNIAFGQTVAHVDWDKMYREIIAMPSIQTVRRTSIIKKLAIAASILLVLSTGAYFMFFNKEQKQTAQTEIKHDVAPPQATKAMITLSNGQLVPLDSIANGTLATQGDIKVLKTKDGQIVYEGSELTPDSYRDHDSQLTFNTLTNPRGSKVIDIKLADGSRVWLNAGSSVTYPVAFVGKERNVELKGEGYFEIAHNASMPFHVNVKDMTVEVLGTHFNVNAYEDENSINTTLLEGSVKIANKILKPGQQAQFTNNEIKIANANIEEVMAWKNGVFQFEGADIKLVMRQIARWYDVDVEYRGNVDQHFRGSISRNVEASKVFQMLELTKAVHFEIVGKKVIVK